MYTIKSYLYTKINKDITRYHDSVSVINRDESTGSSECRIDWESQS